MIRIVQFILLLIIASASATCFGQSPVAADSIRSLPSTDSIIVKDGKKVVTIESYAARYDPRKAMLYSAVLPGLGQIYNKKYWKLPLVYGGFIGLGFGIKLNQDRYLTYKNGLFGLLNEPVNPVVNPETGLTKYGNRVVDGVALFPLSTGGAVKLETLRPAVNRVRRDRDYLMVLTFVFYMLQMVDAHVDAHLKEFDVNPQLKVSFEPVINQNAFTGRSGGLGLTLKF